METLPASPALRPRRTGWTAERQAAFIGALGETASVTAAAARVGMTPQSAHWLRRQPAAADFRNAWNAALALTWAQVEATALDRVLNGEIETIERDGISVTRHRPCNARLLVHMVDRAIAARERAEAVAASSARALMRIRVERLRDEIRALAARDSADGDNPALPDPDREPEPTVVDDATLALQKLEDIARGFTDRPDPLTCDETAADGGGNPDDRADLRAGAASENPAKQENKENNTRLAAPSGLSDQPDGIADQPDGIISP